MRFNVSRPAGSVEVGILGVQRRNGVGIARLGRGVMCVPKMPGGAVRAA
ncbi:MAG: hypothetical protein AAF699_19590 [Pseudomonadota bacterium]